MLLRAGILIPESLSLLAVRPGQPKLEKAPQASEKKSAAVNSALFEIILRGAYRNIRHFIAGLTELEEFVTVERVSLSTMARE